jgi:hydroxyacylglutathione hydrolase
MFMRMIYDDKLAQAAYLIGCQRTGEAIVIDPERDVDRYIEMAEENDLRITAVAETHIHADFLSGARELAERVGAKVYVSDEGDEDWKYQWLDKKVGGGAYDHQLLKDGDLFSVGNIEFKVVHTPGHTPEHICFLVTDKGAGATEPIGFATGDFVFVGDLGRPDLLETAAGQTGAMEPSARRLYETVKRLETIPEFTQVWPAHGAGSACGKSLGAVPFSTVGYEKRFNPALKAASSEQEFVDFMLTGQPEPPMYFARMKRDNKIGPKVLGELPYPPRMTPKELLSLDTRKAAVIDTRDWDDFRVGHLKGAMSFPLTNSFNTDAGSLIDEEEPIYLIIEPDRVEEAVRDLVRIGLDDIRGWCDANEMDALKREGAEMIETKEIDAQEASSMLDQPGVRILDVRRKTEYDEGHIPGAVNIAHTRLPSRLDEVPRDESMIVHCRSGKRSARATAYLERLGYDVTNLAGGIIDWEKASAPVER